MSTPASKIFGIGLSKTGTTSLAHALEILGYKTKDYPGITRYRAGDLASIDLSVVDAHDALTDTPIPSFYRELDRQYPNSKFILTVREKDGWLKSCKKQFNEKLAARQNEAHNQLFMDLYGCVVFDEEKFSRGYDRFVSGVLEYFKDRPQDLLVLDITSGEGWEKLCPFLGRPIPDIPFPKANVTQINWMNIADMVAIARQAGRASLKRHRTLHATGMLARVFLALQGGVAGAVKRARRTAHAQIVEGLRRLNSQIPILSPEHPTVAYAERAQWHHLWLIDPLDGEDAFVGNSGEFTLNIALIQDGSPLFGVVYAPKTDTVYFARVGKGAFRARGNEEPKPLGRTAPSGAPTEPTGSLALELCHAAEGLITTRVWNGPFLEWKTAAAHLVAAESGMRVCDCGSKQKLKYNTEDLLITCVSIE